MTGRTSRRLVLAVCLMTGLAAPAPAQQINYNVSYVDPNHTSDDLIQSFTLQIQAAGSLWNNYLRPTNNIVLDVQVVIDSNVTRVNTGSVLITQIGTFNGMNLHEQGAATEIRTGTDPNGAEADIRLTINPNYLRNTLWFDPTPFQRTAAVPSDKQDAVSVVLHELGHALAFSGYRNAAGDLTGNDLTTFDKFVSKTGSDLFFDGPQAKALYGGQPVPLTAGSPYHLGNASPGLGSDLVPDLMNGVALSNGTRYDISLLDVAILADSEVPVVPVPEPVLGLGVAAVGLAGWALRRSRRTVVVG